MNLIQIYDGVTNAKKCIVKPLDTSEIYKLKNSDDKIILDFKLNEPIYFDVNDYIVFDGQYYYMRRMPKVSEQPALYTYNIEFIGGVMLLKDAKYLLITDTTSKLYIDNKFYVARTPYSLLQDIVYSMNRVSKIKYNIGTVNASYENSVMSLYVSDWNCLEAISEFQKNIGFDWWLDTKTNTLHFDSRFNVEKIPYLSFSTGVNNGLNSMTRIVADSDTIYTRVYAYGSTENMPDLTVYRPSCLKENRLDLGEIPYIEKNVEKYGIIETVQIFDTIKPSYTSTVSNVDGLNRFNDTLISLNPNDYKINGNQNFSIVFSSGLLQGITFEVTNFDNGWFTFNSTESGGIPMPSTDFYAKVGDSYTLINLNMPIEYVESAQAKLLTAAQEYLDSVSSPNDQFELDIDSFYLMKRYKEMDDLKQDYKLDLGRNMYILSNVNNIDGLFEIKEIRQKINNPFNIEIKVGDVLPKTLLTKIKQIEFNSNNYSSVVSNSINNTFINGSTVAWDTF